jgi:hypothetical protein
MCHRGDLWYVRLPRYKNGSAAHSAHEKSFGTFEGIFDVLLLDDTAHG